MLLAAAEAALLARAPFTYDDVGATRGALPAGYRQLEQTRRLRGRTFAEAAELVLTWQLHERSGLRVAADGPKVGDGAVVVLGFGVGPARLPIPCRVAYVVDEPGRVGFAYGTLPGHPEEGEELFLVESLADGGVQLTVRVFSRPATRLARIGGPMTRAVQNWMTRRYLRALDA
ncbi:DUF1990 family protein [Nocardioides jejuensis]|uniref:DUF1990 domain-containing protein n=1 Tax=Nocardioides jejuensis TaxID=2502782 RepID=A0A4R1CCZ1_9ACTN|nr:DUF1990 domain-containing protein [Nocardioides jejuensis]TCJ28045.1 DUF1990 domain-containing protein [Nocardioides jejuensis]